MLASLAAFFIGVLFFTHLNKFLPLLKYAFLGVVQGLTEFLPVSSTGHLLIFQSLLKVQDNIAFDTVVHLATAVALIIYFRQDILRVLNPKADSLGRKMLWLLVVGTFFTGIVGIAFKDLFESLFSSVFYAGVFFIVTGLVILLGEHLGKGKRDLEKMKTKDAVLIGLAQGAAIIPSLSRSGTTISMALGLNLNRELAARYSFLLSIPAILGAGLLQSKGVFKAGTAGIGVWPLLLGFLTAFVSSWFAIKLLLGIIQRTSLRGFAYYCMLVGVIVMVVALTF